VIPTLWQGNAPSEASHGLQLHSAVKSRLAVRH
jgi:hypothetical protein